MIQTCLFPAAGYGTRFLPATKSLPKEMLPIFTKPLIHYGVDEALEAGMKNMAFITGRAIEDDLLMVSDMVEKPDPKEAPSNLAVIGRYILTPDIFTILERTKPGKNGEVQITDALKEQAKDGMVLAYKFKGKRFDCGSVEGFVQATNFFYELGKNAKK